LLGTVFGFPTAFLLLAQSVVLLCFSRRQYGFLERGDGTPVVVFERDPRPVAHSALSRCRFSSEERRAFELPE
jgi:hypothetical protein